jgi:lipoprotein-releasing system ATP-binding protein
MSANDPQPANVHHHLRVEGLHKSFNINSANDRLIVLDDLGLELFAGDSLAIVGPSGSGKSTLLQIIGTLDHPDQGSVSIDGTDPFTFGDQQLAQFRNDHIGFVFQDHHLLPQLNVLENVLLPTLAFGKASDQDITRATDLVDRVGMSDRIDHLPSELSGGQKERVAIARALVMSPSLILADEPTGNLDAATANEMTALLLELQQAFNAILITVTHSVTLASAMSQQQTLVNGKLQTIAR